MADPFNVELTKKLKELMRECDLDTVTSKEVIVTHAMLSSSILTRPNSCVSVWSSTLAGISSRTKALSTSRSVHIDVVASGSTSQMIVIMGQMDKASHVFENVYLGTEWNASNIEELETNKYKSMPHLRRISCLQLPFHHQCY